MRRRDFLRLAGAAAVALPTTARAQFNTSKPITMIVPFPAGGGADILVRLLTKYMAENLGHPFIVQNQPGAGGGLAFGQVARAAPDGQTLGWISTGFPVMAATLSNLTSYKRTSYMRYVREVPPAVIDMINELMGRPGVSHWSRPTAELVPPLENIYGKSSLLRFQEPISSSVFISQSR